MIASPRNRGIVRPVAKHQMLSSEKLSIAIELRELSCPKRIPAMKTKDASLCAKPDFRYGEKGPSKTVATKVDYTIRPAIPAPISSLVPSEQRTQRRRSSLLFTPGHATPPNEDRKERKRHSLTFSTVTETKEIPRYTADERTEAFWTEAELNLMRCEDNMRKAGIDNPDTFDWKNFR